MGAPWLRYKKPRPGIPQYMVLAAFPRTGVSPPRQFVSMSALTAFEIAKLHDRWLS